MKMVLAEDAKRQHEANRKALRQGKHVMAEDKAAKQVEALGHGIQQGRWAAANAQAQRKRQQPVEEAIEAVSLKLSPEIELSLSPAPEPEPSG